MAGLLLPLEGLYGVRMHAVNIECFREYLMSYSTALGAAVLAALRCALLCTVTSVCIVYSGFIACLCDGTIREPHLRMRRGHSACRAASGVLYCSLNVPVLHIEIVQTSTL